MVKIENVCEARTLYGVDSTCFGVDHVINNGLKSLCKARKPESLHSSIVKQIVEWVRRSPVSCACIFPQQNDFQNDCLNINKGAPALPLKMSLMSEWNSGSNLVTAKLITFIQRSNLRIKFSMESVESLRIANPCSLKELDLRRTIWLYCAT